MEQNSTYIYDGMNAFEKEVKRWFDFFAALLCIIIFSPLFLICYIAIKRTNRFAWEDSDVRSISINSAVCM